MKKLKNHNKGQALVEFVIILPIIMMIIFVIIDFANVFYQKNHLENVVNDAVVFSENSQNKYKEKLKKEDINITYKTDANELTVKGEKKVSLVTPFAGMFFKNPYVIKTERIVLYE